MERIDSTDSVLQADGIVQHVDTVNRELHVLLDGTSISFDVPPNCLIILNWERVKLRLLQPADHVRLFYREEGDGARTVRRIDVQAGHPSPRS